MSFHTCAALDIECRTAEMGGGSFPDLSPYFIRQLFPAHDRCESVLWPLCRSPR